MSEFEKLSEERKTLRERILGSFTLGFPVSHDALTLEGTTTYPTILFPKGIMLKEISNKDLLKNCCFSIK